MSEDKSRTRRKTLIILIVGVALGIIFWGGFNTAMEATNTETFCVSCHEMEANVYQELQDTIHYANRTGVRATCPDCHVPKDWVYKFARKVRATNELYHHFMGSVDTPKKFEEKRIELAQHVWQTMKATDSRECRNCHNYQSMSFEKQTSRSQKRHEDAEAQGLTCIDCHKGIAHHLPYEYDPEKDIPGKSIYYTQLVTTPKPSEASPQPHQP
jgi:cytochrome c-type protein NapC